MWWPIIKYSLLAGALFLGAGEENRPVLYQIPSFLLHCAKNLITNKYIQIAGVTIVVGISTIAFLLIRGIKQINARALLPENEKRKDGVVYLTTLRRGFALNASSPCLKVEAFLRLHKIPYVVEYAMKPESKNERFPYAKLNGEMIEDSEAIIKRVIDVFHIKDSSENFEPSQLAACHALEVMLFQFDYWLSIRHVFVDNLDWLVDHTVAPIPKNTWWGPIMIRFFMNHARGDMIDGLNKIGFGDYSDSEYHAMWKEDTKTISRLLGDNKYLFTQQDKPSKYDCVVFAVLEVMFGGGKGIPSPAYEYAINDKNLVAYYQRLRSKLFPDAEELLKNDNGTLERFDEVNLRK